MADGLATCDATNGLTLLDLYTVGAAAPYATGPATVDGYDN